MSTLISEVKVNGGLGASPGIEVPSAISPSMSLLPRRGIDPHKLRHMKLAKPVLAIMGAEVLDGNLPL
jgi:hypothetical protein